MASRGYSKLAILMAAPSGLDDNDDPDWDAVNWCDSQLQEVREVLELLQNLPYQKPPCFCRIAWQSGHDGPCQRTRELWTKLRIAKEQG